VSFGVDESRLERLLDLVQARHLDRSLPITARICMICSDALDVDGAGVSLLTGTEHRSISASDDVSEAIEAMQVATRQGPCIDACATRCPVMQADMLSPSADERWPLFSAGVRQLGVGAVFGFPLLVDRRPIGALDLYSRRPHALTDTDVIDALILADMAALAVTTAEICDVAVVTTSEPEQDWGHPSIVHQASGMTSVQLGITVDEALLRLRAHAFAADRPLVDIATDIVSRRLRIEAWRRD
jgi:transcriptional regulator with GAF, ATPase, and Fis domain